MKSGNGGGLYPLVSRRCAWTLSRTEDGVCRAAGTGTVGSSVIALPGPIDLRSKPPVTP